MKILIDMNLSPLWVNIFAKQNIEAIHWASVGDPRATDRVIMEFQGIKASRYRLALLTQAF
ncbi:DUF5615 family PIN-like protein [Thermoleptolyngbya sp.]